MTNMAKIDFEIKTDRQLLLLVAQASNNTEEHISLIEEHLRLINGKISKHESRLQSCEAVDDYGFKPSLSHKLFSNNLFGLGMGGTLFGGMIYAFGNAMGWW